MKVVILGGGFCGSMVAKRLDGDIPVTLIDRQPYFEYYPSLPKLITDPGYHEKIIKYYSDYLDNVNILTEEVKKITPRGILTDRRRLNYDILVISLGARYPIFLENKRDIFTIRSGSTKIALHLGFRRGSDPGRRTTRPGRRCGR